MLWSKIKQGRGVGRVGCTVREGFRKRHALSRARNGSWGAHGYGWEVCSGVEYEAEMHLVALGMARRSMQLEWQEGEAREEIGPYVLPLRLLWM